MNKLVLRGEAAPPGASVGEAGTTRQRYADLGLVFMRLVTVPPALVEKTGMEPLHLVPIALAAEGDKLSLGKEIVVMRAPQDLAEDTAHPENAFVVLAFPEQPAEQLTA